MQLDLARNKEREVNRLSVLTQIQHSVIKLHSVFNGYAQVLH